MLIVIPVSSHDASLIPAFSKAVRHFGAQSGFEAVVVARPSDEGHAQDLKQELDGLFDSVTVHVFSQDGPSGWPLGANFYWSSTIHYVQTVRRSAQPWLWMELDCVPLAKDWAMRLLTEYNLAKMPFMGVKQKTHATDNMGQIAAAGDHMVGAGIYPANISQFSQLWPFVPQMPTPFDVVCQWEIVPRLHDTKLIQHGFRTRKYTRKPDGTLQGVDENEFPHGIRFDQPVRPDAVLFHGCDDGSLIEAILAPAVEVTRVPSNSGADVVVVHEPPKPSTADVPLDVDAFVPKKRKVSVPA